LTLIRDLEVQGQYLYVGDDESGLSIVDVSDPTNMVHAGNLLLHRAPIRLHVVDRYAYVADWMTGVFILDISEPRNIRIVGQAPGVDRSTDIFVDANRAYVANPGGFKVFHIQHGTNMVLINTLPSPAESVYVADRTIFLPELWIGLRLYKNLPGVQVMMRVDAEPGLPLEILAANNLDAPFLPIFATNSPVMPVDFVDQDVAGPKKLYRVRQ
jgi:hypothetical protein